MVILLAAMDRFLHRKIPISPWPYIGHSNVLLCFCGFRYWWLCWVTVWKWRNVRCKFSTKRSQITKQLLENVCLHFWCTDKDLHQTWKRLSEISESTGWLGYSGGKFNHKTAFPAIGMLSFCCRPAVQHVYIICMCTWMNVRRLNTLYLREGEYPTLAQ